MFKYSEYIALALLAGIATSTVYAADKVADQSKIAVTVNGIAVPQDRVALRVKAAAQQGQQDSPELRKAIKDDLINLEVLSQEAAKKGLDKQTDLAQQLELARQSVLAGAFVQDYAKSHPVSEEAMKQEYETLKNRLGGKEYKVAHILLATEDEAKAVSAALKKKGAKFDKIAKEKSNDPGSKQQGGDLGWSVPGNFVPQFAEAITKLGKGQISEPVQTQFGWHIVKLDDIRDLKIPSFEEVRPNIQNRLQQQAIQKLITDLRANAKIE